MPKYYLAADSHYYIKGTIHTGDEETDFVSTWQVTDEGRAWLKYRCIEVHQSGLKHSIYVSKDMLKEMIARKHVFTLGYGRINNDYLRMIEPTLPGLNLIVTQKGDIIKVKIVAPHGVSGFPYRMARGEDKITAILKAIKYGLNKIMVDRTGRRMKVYIGCDVTSVIRQLKNPKLHSTAENMTIVKHIHKLGRIIGSLEYDSEEDNLV